MMNGALRVACVLGGLIPVANSLPAEIPNGGFESGDFVGWKADPNWIVTNAAGRYSRWEGQWYAWSGGDGQASMGKLRSSDFVLDREGVQVCVAGWQSFKAADAGVWNYVTLHLVDGTEIDRVYAPNSLVFQLLTLQGHEHKGERVYVEAVDNADRESWSRFCIDHLKTVTLPPRLFANFAFPTEDIVKIENDLYLVEVDRKHGLITRILDKKGRIDMLNEPRLANNFKFTLPLRGKHSNIDATEGNYLLGARQRLSSADQSGAALTLRWDAPLRSELGDSYDVDVEMKVELVDSAVRFGLKIKNRTPFPVGEVWYPMLGGMTGLGNTPRDRTSTMMTLPTESISSAAHVGGGSNAPLLPTLGKSGVGTADVFRHFGNFSSLGTPVPERFYSYPGAMFCPWADFSTPRLSRGIYFGAHDPIARLKVLHLELFPGVAHGRIGGNWPNPGELKGLPAGVTVNWVHFPYSPPGAAWTASRVELRFHDGKWANSPRAYHHWLKTAFQLTKRKPTWLRREAAFQEVSGIKFKDLRQWAARSRANGINVLLLKHWRKGGPGLNLSHCEPDPALGNWTELAQALEECHEMGVKVLFSFAFQPVNPQAAWDQPELKDFACRDRWGNTYPAVRLNPGHPEFRKIVVGQMRKLAEAGVDGVHVHPLLPFPIDFHPALPATPDRAPWEGTLQCLDEVLQACRAANPGFSLCVSDLWDRLLQYTDVVLFSPNDPARFKKTHLPWQPAVTVSRGDQFAVINRAVQFNAQLRLTVPADDPSMKGLAPYIKEIQRLRRELHGFLTLGEFLGNENTRIEGTGKYSVFRNPSTGRHACVLVNPRSAPCETSVVSITRNHGQVRLYQPFQTSRMIDLPFKLKIPAGRLAIVVEE